MANFFLLCSSNDSTISCFLAVFNILLEHHKRITEVYRRVELLYTFHQAYPVLGSYTLTALSPHQETDIGTVYSPH